ncbi:MAG: imidazole glycerol phosphate synthase subunit HisH [Gammaproteobacteria bacterium]|nr:imidazole glycerol phosphate synthase subunit HisH [Gammaproteobacteria bacterium]
MIGIISYGLGNVLAFSNIYKKLEIPHKIVSKPEDLESISKLILPGVGSFDDAMRRFTESGLKNNIDYLVQDREMPILGICVGMQMMADSSDEGNLKGLSWLKGKVKKFNSIKKNNTMPLPHMGWNDISIKKETKLVNGLEKSKFYFLHSYYVEPNDLDFIISQTDYIKPFCSIINYKNIYGIQCHPEKSHQDGILLLKNFSEL